MLEGKTCAKIRILSSQSSFEDWPSYVCCEVPHIKYSKQVLDLGVKIISLLPQNKVNGVENDMKVTRISLYIFVLRCNGYNGTSQITAIDHLVCHVMRIVLQLILTLWGTLCLIGVIDERESWFCDWSC